MREGVRSLSETEEGTDQWEMDGGGTREPGKQRGRAEDRGKGRRGRNEREEERKCGGGRKGETTIKGHKIKTIYLPGE